MMLLSTLNVIVLLNHSISWLLQLNLTLEIQCILIGRGDLNLMLDKIN